MTRLGIWVQQNATMRRLSRSLTTSRPKTFPQLLRLKLPGKLSAWEQAGFARNADVDDFALSIGAVDVAIGSTGLSAWGWRDGPRTRDGVPERDPPCWDGLAADNFAEVAIDSIQTSIDDLDAAEHLEHTEAQWRASTTHPNGALGIYSVCVTTPTFDATVEAFEQAGLQLRRVRKASDPASALSRGLSMAFFKFGAPPGRDVILELVGPGTSDAAVGAAVAVERAGFAVGEGATIAGMVVEVPAIAPLASLLGPSLLGEERDAAQGHGRRIAPLKHKAAGLPIPLAFITPSTGA